MKFRDTGDEFAFTTKIFGTSAIIGALIAGGPLAPIVAGLGSVAIGSATIGNKLADWTTRRRRKKRKNVPVKIRVVDAIGNTSTMIADSLDFQGVDERKIKGLGKIAFAYSAAKLIMTISCPPATSALNTVDLLQDILEKR